MKRKKYEIKMKKTRNKKSKKNMKIIISSNKYENKWKYENNIYRNERNKYNHRKEWKKEEIQKW